MLKLLIAEDNNSTRATLADLTANWGFEVVAVSDGAAAWSVMQQSSPPTLLLLDLNMPRLDGLELCRLIRGTPRLTVCYIILLTGQAAEQDLVAGLEGGADEYLAKPVNCVELRARLKAGKRVAELQQNLAEKVSELEAALRNVKTLNGLLPICSYCKRVRDDGNYWQQVEAYIAAHSDAQFSHGICPDCYEKCVRPELEELGLK